MKTYVFQVGAAHERQARVIAWAILKRYHPKDGGSLYHSRIDLQAGVFNAKGKQIFRVEFDR